MPSNDRAYRDVATIYFIGLTNRSARGTLSNLGIYRQPENPNKKVCLIFRNNVRPVFFQLRIDRPVVHGEHMPAREPGIVAVVKKSNQIWNQPDYARVLIDIPNILNIRPGPDLDQSFSM